MATIQEILERLAVRLQEVPTAEEEKAAVGSGVAISRYVAGMTDEMELRGDLLGLGYSGLKLERYVLQAQLQRQLELFKDRLADFRQRYKDGQLTQAEFLGLLERSGATQEQVILERSRVVAIRLPTVARAIEVSLSVQVPEALELPTEARAIEVSLALVEVTVAPARPPAVVKSIAIALSVQVPEVREIPTQVRQIEVSLALIEIETAPEA